MSANVPSAAAQTYGETGMRERLEFAGLLVLWWGVIVGVLTMTPDAILDVLGFPLLVALGLLAFVPILFLGRWQRRRRVARMQAALLRHGYSFRRDPSWPERQAVIDQLGALALLKQGADHVEWIARRHVAGRDLTIVRHSHIDGGGRTWYDRTSTIVAINAGDAQPGVWLSRTNTLTARRDEDLGHAQDLSSGDPWLDANFRIQSHDAASLTRILTPPVRALIATGPWKESWTIGYGWVMCIFGADTAPEGVAVMVQRVQRMAALV